MLYLPLRRGDVTVHDERIVHGSGALTVSSFCFGRLIVCEGKGRTSRLTFCSFFSVFGADGNTSTTRTRKTYVVAFRSEVCCD